MKNERLTGMEARKTLQKYNAARSNLLLAIILTAVNIVLLLFGSGTMLLFSATIPYFIALVGLFSGMPAVSICLTVAVVILLVYLLCWYFSKKHFAWMVTALVLFVFDTVFMIWIYFSEGDFSGILDVFVHAWVLYYLISGVITGPKATKIKLEDLIDEAPAVAEPAGEVIAREIPPVQVTEEAPVNEIPKENVEDGIEH